MEMIVIQKNELIHLIREEFRNLSIPVITAKNRPEEDITDIRGISALTGWAEQTIYSKHSRGEFPKGCVFKSGKKLFFSKSGILEFIKSN